MLTRKRIQLPVLSGDWKTDGPNLLGALNAYLLSLENKNSLTIDSATGIDNTPIGANAASTGAFSSVSSTGTGGIPTYTATVTDATTQSRAALDMLADSSEIFIATHASARTITRYGLTLGGWVEISSFANTGTPNGIVIGTQTNKPLVFGVNNAEVGRFTSTGLSLSVPVNQVATAILTLQGADVTKASAHTAASTGWYRAIWQTTTTRAATSSATLPSARIYWTDPDASVEGAASGNASVTSLVDNAVGAKRNGSVFMYVKTGTAISYDTINYASSGATSMQFSFRLSIQKIT